MSALYRLKAYFGMVPAEELDDYAFGEDDRDLTGDDYDYEPYEPAYKQSRRSPEAGHGQDRRAGRTRWNEQPDRYESDGYDKDYDAKAYDGKNYSAKDYSAKDCSAKNYDAKNYDTDGYYTDEPEPARPARHGNAHGWAAEAPVRGALAVDPNRETREAREVRTVPDAREVHVAARTRPAPAEEVHPLARITTLHPRTYNEARTIGEHYREGIPVIMNLTEMTDADAKRLVDFAAGLAFALRGSIDKITTKVFLISPPNVDVTAEDRRRLAEGSFLNRSV